MRSLVAAALLLAPTLASAREFRVDEIPNGDDKSCLNCHLTLEGEHFTTFGSDVKFSLIGAGELEDQHVDWQAVFAFDSDGDTFTNGEELLDPTGAWTVGAANPPGVVTNPGNKESHPPGVCDNGVLEPDEGCDSGQLQTTTCAELGLGTGLPSCGQACAFDLNGCSMYAPPTAGEGTSGEDAASGCAMRGAAPTRGPARWPWLVALVAIVLLRRRFAPHPHH